ncbi:MAG: Uma2 family endonuclease [Caldilineaceae bacterium SB0664_bin_22]|nr:Uma2 family endonuclease [Caldilineaceae bacterium SB0664_bin_22]
MGSRTGRETMMDAVAIRERTQAAPNGRAEELHPDADPYMTRAARTARTAWRLEHLEEWHRDLETLFYYDPEYAYDVVHEYEDEWTTDPDHSGNGIKFYEFDEGGVLEPTDDRRTMLEGAMLNLLRTVLGNRAESQGRLYFPGNIAERLKLLTRGGNRGSYVKPDLMVFPSVYELPTGVHRDRSDCALRTHEGEPPPELVVEILSVSSVARDYGVKARLYAALGVAEYWVCDVGGIRGPDSPVELSVFRLGADGLYAPVSSSQPPAGSGDRWEVPVYGSGVLDRPFRLRPGAYEPRFQWWDAAQGRWRDPESDVAFERQAERDRHVRELQATRVESRAEGRVEGRVEGIAIGETKVAIAVLHALLSNHLHSRYRDQIEAHWRKAGPPQDMMDCILKVQQAPAEWRSLLQIPEENSDTGSR